MYGRNSKKQLEEGRGRAPRVPVQQPTKPTFSYYANRPPDVSQPERRSNDRVKPNSSIRRRARPTLRLPLGRMPYWVLAIIIVVCVVKLLYLGTNPKLVVLGKTSVTNTYLQPTDTYTRYAHTLLSSSVTNHTKLTANISGTTAALQQQFPELESVSVAAPLIGNRPIVYVEVAQPSAVLQSAGLNYAMNRNGLILAKLSSLPAGIPALTDQSQAVPHIGKQYLPSSTIRFISTVSYQFKAAGLVTSAYVLPQASPYELDVRLQGSPYLIKFNLQGDAMVQSGAAIGTNKQLASKQPSAYIDVRVPGRVYYK